MKISSILSVLLALGISGASMNAALAARYFLAPIDAVGVAENDAKTVDALMRGAFKREGQTLVDQERNAEFVVHARILKLGQSLILSVDKNEGEKLRYSGQMRAGQIEEMDRVAERVVRALIIEEPTEKTAAIGKVTESESRSETTRRYAVSGWYLGFGPATSHGLGQGGLLLTLSGAYGWQVNPLTSLSIFWDGTSGTSNVGDLSFTGFGLRGQHALNGEDSAPFVLVAAGYGGANGAGQMDRTITGFMTGVGAGYRFFRTSSVNLEVALQYSVILKSGPDGIPGILGARIGIYF